MRSLAFSVLAVFLVVLSGQAAAQPRLEPDSVLLLDGLELALSHDDALDRYLAYTENQDTLARVAAGDPLLPMLLPILQLEVGGDLVAAFQKRAAGTLALDRPEALEWSAQEFLAGAYYNSRSSEPTRKDLYNLGKSLDRLNAAGMSYAQIRGAVSPLIVDLMDKALKLYKAGLSAEELVSSDAPERGRIVRDFIGLIPPGLSPALSGPGGVALSDALQWNGQMWDATSEGIDLVADAIATGRLDMGRHAAVAARIEALVTKGPWGGDTATTFFKQWATALPGLGKFLKAVWPEPVPEQCKAINCDCDNVTMELFGEYRKACLAEQEMLLSKCIQSKVVSGACHITASGPDAFP